MNNVMIFDKLQESLWGRMLDAVNNYRQNKITFSEFVNNLESTLIAGDFPDDESLLSRWYDKWTPLEILNATYGDKAPIQEVEPYLSQMQNFLEKILRLVRNDSAI